MSSIHFAQNFARHPQNPPQKPQTKPKIRRRAGQRKTAAKCATSRRVSLCAWRAGNALTVQGANQAAPRPAKGNRELTGGRKRGRPSDLSLVRAALSQLSYPPAPGILRGSGTGVNRESSPTLRSGRSPIARL